MGPFVYNASATRVVFGSDTLASLGEESRHARDDRKAGIVLTRLPCPALVVASTGDLSFPPTAYTDLAVPAERLVVAPDCGMKYLARATAIGKLKALADGAAIVRKELAG